MIRVAERRIKSFVFGSATRWGRALGIEELADTPSGEYAAPAEHPDRDQDPDRGEDQDRPL